MTRVVLSKRNVSDVSAILSVKLLKTLEFLRKICNRVTLGMVLIASRKRCLHRTLWKVQRTWNVRLLIRWSKTLGCQGSTGRCASVVMPDLRSKKCRDSHQLRHFLDAPRLRHGSAGGFLPKHARISSLTQKAQLLACAGIRPRPAPSRQWSKFGCVTRVCR
jgi:hypothetical protein